MIRPLLLVPAGLALLAGLDAALVLLGLPAPVRATRPPEVHGVLMVLGFLGTLIALERAVALRRRAAFAAPCLLGLGGLLLISPLPWLVGFVVLTIAGERLELARIGMGPATASTEVLLAFALVVAVVAALLWSGIGAVLFGLVVSGLAVWFGSQDLARRMIRSSGLPLLGLVRADGVRVAGGRRSRLATRRSGYRRPAVRRRDPCVLSRLRAVDGDGSRPGDPACGAAAPAGVPPGALCAGRAAPWSLALRLWAGDALGNRDAWVTGGAFNIAAVLSFAALAVWSMTHHRERTAA